MDYPKSSSIFTPHDGTPDVGFLQYSYEGKDLSFYLYMGMTGPPNISVSSEIRVVLHDKDDTEIFVNDIQEIDRNVILSNIYTPTLLARRKSIKAILNTFKEMVESAPPGYFPKKMPIIFYEITDEIYV